MKGKCVKGLITDEVGDTEEISSLGIEVEDKGITSFTFTSLFKFKEEEGSSSLTDSCSVWMSWGESEFDIDSTSSWPVLVIDRDDATDLDRAWACDKDLESDGILVVTEFERGEDEARGADVSKDLEDVAVLIFVSFDNKVTGKEV